MKRIAFVVVMEFSEPINLSNQIDQIANNTLSGLIDQANTAGLAPTDSDAFTKSIEVSESGIICCRHDFIE